MNILRKLLGPERELATKADRIARRDELLSSVEAAKIRIAEDPFAREHTRQGEFFDEDCVCAVADRGFIVRYVRQPTGLYRAESCHRAGRTAAKATVSGLLGVALSVEQFEGVVPCPWCGSREYFHCGCGATVCGGRFAGNVFTCRDSCGRRWRPTGKVRELKGNLSQNHSPAALNRRTAGDAEPRPASNRLLLR